MRPPFADAGPTGTIWLENLKRHETAAWRRLQEIYGRLVYARCRGAGLSAHDAADVVQEVLRTVAANLERFTHRGPGSFRAWLRAIYRTKLADHFRRAQQPVAVGGSDAVQRLASVPQPVDQVEEAKERALLVHIMLQRLRPAFDDRTWKAFWRLLGGRQSAAEIGKELGMTDLAVRQAKARILRRLREELEET